MTKHDSANSPLPSVSPAGSEPVAPRHKPHAEAGETKELTPCACPQCGCEDLTILTLGCELCLTAYHVPCAPDCEMEDPHIPE